MDGQKMRIRWRLKLVCGPVREAGDICGKLQVQPAASAKASGVANKLIQGSTGEPKLDVGFMDDLKAENDS